MKIHGIVRIGNRPVFMKWGKHYCPACNARLKKVKISQIVNSHSEEAKNFKYKNYFDNMAGNIKFIWTEYTCETCQKEYSVDEIHRAEKRKSNLKQHTINAKLTLIAPNEKVQVPTQIIYERDDDTALLSSEIHLTYNGIHYCGKGTDYLWTDTFANLQKQLPDDVTVACCMTCRHGNLCPYGNEQNQLFCLKDTVVHNKEDVLALFDNDDIYDKGSLPCCHYCADFEAQSKEYYTYNDYAFHL